VSHIKKCAFDTRPIPPHVKIDAPLGKRDAKHVLLRHPNVTRKCVAV
jgi:hypothetical protein